MGQRITFDGGGSQPGSSPIARYDWDFDDGTTASGAVVEHSYQMAPIYRISLTVTDENGLSHQTIFAIRINASP